jgi:hypothetical protein
MLYALVGRQGGRGGAGGLMLRWYRIRPEEHTSVELGTGKPAVVQVKGELAAYRQEAERDGADEFGEGDCST